MEDIDSKENVLKLSKSFEKLCEEKNVKTVLSGSLAPCVKVGVEHQAFVPDLAVKCEQYESDLPYENEDNLQWSPDFLSPELVENYLIQSRGVEGAKSGKCSSDDEDALYLLMQCGYNVNEALRRCKLKTQASSFKTMSPWSENECREFEGGIVKFSKDFKKIQTFFVKTRSLSEVVEFYYFWKKSARRDMLEVSIRRDKKCLDYMDHFVEKDEDNRASLGRRYYLKSSIRKQSSGK